MSIPYRDDPTIQQYQIEQYYNSEDETLEMYLNRKYREGWRVVTMDKRGHHGILTGREVVFERVSNRR